MSQQDLALHVLAMHDDAYLAEHPEWVEIVRDAREACKLVNLLTEARNYLDEFLFMQGSCDHSTNICVCAQRRCLDDLELEIGKQFGHEPRKHMCSRCALPRVKWYEYENGAICEPCAVELEEDALMAAEDSITHAQQRIEARDL